MDHGRVRHQANLEMIGQVGLIAMGRGAYEEMAQAWATGDSPMARLINALPKVVFSTNLAAVDWQNAVLNAGPVEDEMPRLKAERGGDIVVFGAPSFAHSLIRHRLADEYRLTVHPISLGGGSALMHGLPEAPALRARQQHRLHRRQHRAGAAARPGRRRRMRTLHFRPSGRRPATVARLLRIARLRGRRQRLRHLARWPHDDQAAGRCGRRHRARLGLLRGRVRPRRRPQPPRDQGRVDDGVLSRLAAAGIVPDESPGPPDGSGDFLTAWMTDPAGHRIELVQWPPGHADGLTAADWPDD